MDDLISRKGMLSRVARIADISDDAREKMTDAVLGSKAVIDAVRVVRCRDCRWYDPPHIVTDDGFRVNVSGIFPTETELRATFTGATYVGGRCDCPRFKVYCTAHNREAPEDCEDIVVFRKPDEYCSFGEREEADV